MTPLSQSSDIIVLGMNIGSNGRDYEFLLNQSNFSDSLESLSQLMPNDESPLPAGIEEKVFNILERESPSHFADIIFTNPRLQELIVKDGLDILEQHFDKTSTALPDSLNFGEEFVITNETSILKTLNERVKDRYGADQLKKTHPKLVRYLQENYNQSLPKPLRTSVITKVVESIKKFFTKEKVVKFPHNSPKENQIQSLKDRLAENFFKRVVSMTDRPAAVMLQEVFTSNERSIDILEKGRYEIIRPNENSDTAIALDISRFNKRELLTTDHIEESKAQTMVWAQDSKTNEEFIFISCHIPGYNLVVPSDSALISQYLTNVEGTIESTSWPAVRALKDSIKQLSEHFPNASVVVQGDFNTNPEYFSEARFPEITQSIKNMNPFAFLASSSRGPALNLGRTGLPTALNAFQADLPERELDYFVTSQKLTGRVHTIEMHDKGLSLVSGDESGRLQFDPMALFSDHRPIWMKIDGQNSDSI